MSLGDIPKIPEQYQPRIEKLKAKLEEGATSRDLVVGHMTAALGRVRMSSQGVKIKGPFGSMELTADEFKSLILFMKKALDFGMRFRGRQTLIKKDGEVTLLTVDLMMKQKPASPADLANPDLPMIEILDPDEIPRGANVSEPPGIGDRIKIHRIEVLAGWLGDGWDGFARMLDVGVPAIDLTQKATLDRINESFPSLVDDVLERCGV